jgi:hypothetical protein
MDSLITLIHQIPDPAPVAPPGVSRVVTVVFGYGKWLAFAACGLAAITAGARFAVETRQQGSSGDAARQLLFALVGAGVVAGAVALVSAVVA